MARRFGMILAVLGGILFSSPASAQEVLVLGNESMPWNGVVDGKPAGLMVEILNEATKHGAPKFQFQLGLPWARAQEMVHETGVIPKAIIPLTRTTEREAKFKWIAELSPNEIRLVSWGRAEKIRSLDEAQSLTIGIFNGHAAIPTLKTLGLTKLDTSASSAETNMSKLLSKRFDTIADAKMVYLYTWKKLGQKTSDLQEGPMIGEPSHIYIAGDLSFPESVASQIAEALEKMKKDGSLKTILDRWK